MRLVLVLVVALTLVPVALADAPDGFRESPRLGVRAARIAVVPDTRVYCATTATGWQEFALAKAGSRGALGITSRAAREVFLAPTICRTLEGWLRGHRFTNRALALSIHVLTHEAQHVRGTRNEQQADCIALRRFAFAARTFGVKNQKRLTAMRRSLQGRTFCG